MKIAVVGTGAMGSVYAALLAEAGNEVWAVDTWAEHIQAIRERPMPLAVPDRGTAMDTSSVVTIGARFLVYYRLVVRPILVNPISHSRTLAPE